MLRTVKISEERVKDKMLLGVNTNLHKISFKVITKLQQCQY